MMNRSDPRTVSAVVRRDRARRRLRAVTAGTGALGLAVAGGLAFTLPGSAHATASSAGTSIKTGPGSASGATSGGSSGTSSSSGQGSSSGQSSSSASAPSPRSAAASATSGGS
jgi:hypothetical protein